MRLGDAGTDSRLRVDGLARFLQDVASDDSADSGVSSDDIWVARRTAWRHVTGAPWPLIGDRVTLTTWCGGIGAAWAERRTDVEVAGVTSLEAASLWVPIGPEGRPRRIRPEFVDLYGSAAGGRRVAGRVASSPVDPAARRRRWEVRRSDLDVIGHVNNAAVWCAVAEVAPSAVRSASLTHHGALEFGEDVVLATSALSLWLCVGEEVRVSGHFEVD